jgi:hypothetical protein
MALAPCGRFPRSLRPLSKSTGRRGATLAMAAPGRLSASLSSLDGDEEDPFPEGPSSLREPEV